MAFIESIQLKSSVWFSSFSEWNKEICISQMKEEPNTKICDANLHGEISYKLQILVAWLSSQHWSWSQRCIGNITWLKVELGEIMTIITLMAIMAIMNILQKMSNSHLILFPATAWLVLERVVLFVKNVQTSHSDREICAAFRFRDALST